MQWNDFMFHTEIITWSSFTSNLKISADHLFHQIRTYLMIFFPANIWRSFQQIRKYQTIFFPANIRRYFQQIKKIQWSSFPTNQKISDDLFSQQIIRYLMTFFHIKSELFSCPAPCLYPTVCNPVDIWSKLIFAIHFYNCQLIFSKFCPNMSFFFSKNPPVDNWPTVTICPNVTISICKKRQMCQFRKNVYINLNLWS